MKRPAPPPQQRRGAPPPPPALPQIFANTRLLAVNLSGDSDDMRPGVLANLVGPRGGVLLNAMKAAPPTHVVCEPVKPGEQAATTQRRYDSCCRARTRAGAPDAPIVTRNWVLDCVQRRALLDTAPYVMLPPPAAAAAVAAAPVAAAAAAFSGGGFDSADESGDEGAGGSGDVVAAPSRARGAAPPFVPPPPKGDACASCRRPLGWQEIARCQACLESSDSYFRALHLRFLLDHPNKALVAALTELAEYVEMFDSFKSAESFRRGAAVLKAAPADIDDEQALAACTLPFIGEGLKTKYIPQFLATGKIERLERHLCNPEEVAARMLARLPFVSMSDAKAWARAGLQTHAAVWAAHEAGTLRPPLQNEWEKLGMKHAQELLTDMRSEDQAPLVDVVRAAAVAAAPAGSPPELVLVGGAARGKPASHDLDLLITHPREGAERGMLERMLEHIAQSDEIERDEDGKLCLVVALSADVTARSTGGVTRGVGGKKKDVALHMRPWNPEEALKAKQAAAAAGAHTDEEEDGDEAPSRAVANKALVMLKLRGLPLRRVDILVVPRHQFAYWVLGWTGSRELERLLRGHVHNTLKLKLNNTALVTQDDGELITRTGGRVPVARAVADYVQAKAYCEQERDIWDLIGVPWRPFEERNA